MGEGTKGMCGIPWLQLRHSLTMVGVHPYQSRTSCNAVPACDKIKHPALISIKI